MKYPTKEQILKSANKSKEIKETLEKLFPQVFEEEKYFDLNCLNNPKTGGCVYPSIQGQLQPE